MKPRVSYSEVFSWSSAFSKLKELGEGTQVGKYQIAWIHEDPDWIQLSYREKGKKQTVMVRKGDPLIFELASGSC